MKIKFQFAKRLPHVVAAFLFLSLSSCQQEPEELGCTIVYQVIADGADEPAYTVQYLHKDGTEYLVGEFNSPGWESNPIEGFENGDVVRITVNNNGSGTQFTLQIRKNGLILNRKKKFISSGSITLEEVIPVY